MSEVQRWVQEGKDDGGMTREFIESVFSKIPKHVRVAVFGEYNTGCGGAEICVSLGWRKGFPKNKFEKPFLYEKWEPIAYDNELDRNFESIVAEAERMSLQTDEEIRQMQKG